MIVRERSRPVVATLPEAAATTGEPNLSTICAVLVAFVAIWAVYLTTTEAPVAIKHDMAEAYAWGQEFQLGYNQHPPFWAWICGLWFTVFPRTGWAFALLSSTNAAIGLVGAWMLIGDFVRGQRRMAAWVLLLLTPIYTFYSYKYDANIIFLSIWPWAVHYFMKSVQGRKVADSIWFGVVLGLAIMSKYYAAILIVTCLLAVLQHPSRRKYFVSTSPYLSAVIAGAICAPHVWWLSTHRAPPLRYLANISGQGWDTVIVHAGKTLTSGLGMSLGVALVVAMVVLTSQRRPLSVFGKWALTSSVAANSAPASSLCDASMGALMRRVVATLALAPLFLTIVGGIVLRTNVTPEMTIGTFPLLPLMVIEVAGVRDNARLYRIAGRLAVALTVGALVLSPVIALARTYLSSNAMNIAPYQEVAIEATKVWHDRTSLPLGFVAGTGWYENAIVFYSPDRPHVFAYFDYDLNLWVTPRELAKRGLLSVCVSDDSACLVNTAKFTTPETTRTEVSLAHHFWGHVAKPVHFVITVIPPRT